MKKLLLLLLTFTLSSLGIFAQNEYFEQISPNNKVKSINLSDYAPKKSTSVDTDLSFYYWDNNSRFTSELNTFLGATGNADGGFDTLLLYPYSVKFKTNQSGDYWQKTVQGLPIQDSLTLSGITFIGNALNPAGSSVEVNVYKKDLTTLLTSQTVQLDPTFAFQEVVFDLPAVDNDTMLIVWQMASVADSFQIARTHSMWNNYAFGPNPTDVFTSDLPFVGDAAILAVEPNNNNSLLGLIADEFDFFVIPEVSYNLKSEYETSTTELCTGDSLIFTNALALTHQLNPILNYIEWNYLANDVSPVYTSYDLGDGNGVQLTDAVDLEFEGYATANTYEAQVATLIYPWTSTEIIENSHSFTFTLTESPSIEVTAEEVEVCSGESTTISASGADNYVWDNGLGSGASHTVSPVVNTTYTVTADNGGVCSRTEEITITVNELPETPQIIQDGNQLSVDVDASYTVTWYYDGAVVGTGSTHQMGESGEYTVVVENDNGCSASNVGEFDPTSSIAEFEKVTDVQIFPNPSAGKFTVRFSATVEETTVYVIDAVGKQMMLPIYTTEIINNNEFNIDLSHVETGVYFVTFESKSDSFTKRIIVKR